MAATAVATVLRDSRRRSQNLERTQFSVPSWMPRISLMTLEFIIRSCVTSATLSAFSFAFWALSASSSSAASRERRFFARNRAEASRFCWRRFSLTPSPDFFSSALPSAPAPEGEPANLHGPRHHLGGASLALDVPGAPQPPPQRLPQAEREGPEVREREEDGLQDQLCLRRRGRRRRPLLCPRKGHPRQADPHPAQGEGGVPAEP